MGQAIDLIISRTLNAMSLSGRANHGAGPAFGKKLGNQLVGGAGLKAVQALMPKAKSWFLFNTEVVGADSMVFGPWEPENVTETVGSTYADAFSIGRQKAIRQFLHGEVESITFQARFYAVFELLEIEKKVQLLKTWTRRDPDLGRPPVLYFFVGLDQHAKMESCIIRNVSVSYDPPGFLGAMKGATVQITLEQYEPFSLTATESFDTRYHFVKLGDTFEMLAAKEYKDPMLGIQLRQDHPHIMDLSPGDIVKLPAVTGSIKYAKKEPSSIALKSLIYRRDTPQKLVFKEARELRRDRSYRYKTL